MSRWRCKACDWVGVESAILTAPNPFEAGWGDICGCPSCKTVNEFESLCEWDGCLNQSSSGTPLQDGRYVWRCWDHRPAAMGEASK